MTHYPPFSRRQMLTGTALILLGSMANGCGSPACGPCGGWFGGDRPPRGMAAYRRAPQTLGTISDQFWQVQTENVDASNFVIYQHEFKLDGIRLNNAGEDHLKQIAARLLQGANYPVIIERTDTTPDPDHVHHFPIHPNPELDNQRRELVIKALSAMGVSDPENRVVVALPYSKGITASQAERVYNRANSVGNRTGGSRGGTGSGFF